MTFTRGIGVVCGAIIDRIVRWLALSKIHPNVLTFIGLVINIGAAGAVRARAVRWAGVVVIGAGLFDMVDGRVARATNQVTRFGGFFDSVIDRYSDLALYMGLLVYYASINRFFYIVLTAIVMTGSVMVSYTRARAENAIPKCKVGFLERPERVVLIIIGALFGPHGAGAVGNRGALESDRGAPHDLHLAGMQTAGGERAGRHPGPRQVTRRSPLVPKATWFLCGGRFCPRDGIHLVMAGASGIRKSDAHWPGAIRTL